MANSDGQGGSAYPRSVQAGIPRLEVPEGWTAPRIGKLFKVVKRPVDLIDDEEYQLVKARRNRGGIVARERLRGKDILTKSQFRVAEGDFLISRRQIAHGACGIVPAELDGAIVSNEYAVLRPTKLLNADFLRYLPYSIYFQQTCFHSSIGVHVEKLVFNLEDWFRWQIAIPEPDEQLAIASLLQSWDEAIYQTQEVVRHRENVWRTISRKIFPLRQDLDSSDFASRFKVRQHGQIVRGISYDPETDLSDPGVGVLTAAHVKHGEVTLIPEWISVRKAVPKAEQIIRKGDFLVAMSNGSKKLVGKAGLVRKAPSVPLGAGAFCATVRPKNDESMRLLDHAFGSERYKELLHVELAGSSIGNLNDNSLREFEFVWSGDVAHLDVLDAARSILRLERSRLSLLEEQKKGILQLILSGRGGLDAITSTLAPAVQAVGSK